MEKRVTLKQYMKQLEAYIVRNFIFMMFVFILMERFTNFLFSKFIFPYTNLFFANCGLKMDYQGTEMFFGVIIYLVLCFIGFLIQILPTPVAVPVTMAFSAVTDKLFRVEIVQLSRNTNISPSEYFLLQIGVIAVVLVLLLLSLTPYGIAISFFSYAVSLKVQEQEIELEKQRNMMLADVAHDLKTPLTAINGFSQVLKEGLEENEEKKQQYLETIYDNSIRMNEMVCTLFEFLKIESGKFQVNVQKIDICEVFRACVINHLNEFERFEIELDVDIPDDSIMVQADPIYIAKAIDQILTNSYRHNPRGTKVCCKIAVEEYVKIHVMDNGERIPDAIAEHIFEPFGLVDESRSKKNGSGLGLSIANKIMVLHKGRIFYNQILKDGYTKEFVLRLRY